MHALMAMSADGDDRMLVPRPRPQVQVRVVAEKSRINMQIARAVSLELVRRGNSEKRELDIVLMPTNWILQRWAVSVGDGLPREKWDDARTTPPPELDDETAILVDRIYLRAPGDIRTLAHCWYKTPEPITSISNRMGLTDDGMHSRIRRMLHFFRAEFLRAGLRV